MNNSVAIQTIKYNDMGSGDLTIVLCANGESGTIFCLDTKGQVEKTLCPCCMKPETHSGITAMIKNAGIKKLVWPTSYGQAAGEYFPNLTKVKEEKYETEFLVSDMK